MLIKYSRARLSEKNMGWSGLLKKTTRLGFKFSDCADLYYLFIYIHTNIEEYKLGTYLCFMSMVKFNFNCKYILSRSIIYSIQPN